MSELEIIRHGQVNGVSIFFNTVEYRTPHFHPEWELIWVLDGTLLVRSEQKEDACDADDLVVIPPKRIHEFFGKDRAVTFLCLQIAPQAFSYVFPPLEALTTDAVRLSAHLDPGASDEIRRSLCTLMREYLSEMPFYELRCAACCAQILQLVLTGLPVRQMHAGEILLADQRNARLDRFLQYVEEHLAEQPSLSAFAESEHCSVSYMSRFLRKNLNQSFQDFVTRMRFRRACRLIAAGGKRMIDVCEECGFSDYRYFSNCFKKHLGMTPEQYRRTRPSAANARRTPKPAERFYSREESMALLSRIENGHKVKIV